MSKLAPRGDLAVCILIAVGRDPGAQKKYRTKFALDVPLETPRSALDDRIFHSDWTVREGWTRKMGKDFVGNKSWIFTNMDDPELTFDEMQLRFYRRISYEPVFEDNARISWRRVAYDPPLEWIKNTDVLAATLRFRDYAF